MKCFRVLLVSFVVTLCGGASLASVQDDERVTVEEFKQLVARGAVVVLDVRNGEIDRKIKGALHIPYNDLAERAAELPREREIVTYCA